MENVKTEIVRCECGEKLKVCLDRDYYLPFKVLGGRKVAFLDISGEVSLNESCADMLAEKLATIDFDAIVNPVAKSNALAHAVAVRLMRKTGKDFSHTVVARKAKRGETHRVDATYRSVTTPVDQTMYLTDDDADFIKGKKVLLIDDVFGQGGTTKGLKELVAKAGAEISAHAVIAIEQNTNHPRDLVYLFELPVID